MNSWVTATRGLLLAGFALLALIGCTQPARPTETPECLPMPMTTGEAFYPIAFQTPFPSQVTAGQTVHIQFSGGIMLMPEGYNCGGAVTVMPPNRATAQASTRQIQISLDETVVDDQSCGYDCSLAFVVPTDIAPGSYHWRLDVPWAPQEQPVQVLPPATEAGDGR
jgi:hypothetical protein